MVAIRPPVVPPNSCRFVKEFSFLGPNIFFEYTADNLTNNIDINICHIIRLIAVLQAENEFECSPRKE